MITFYMYFKGTKNENAAFVHVHVYCIGLILLAHPVSTFSRPVSVAYSDQKYMCFYSPDRMLVHAFQGYFTSTQLTIE